MILSLLALQTAEQIATARGGLTPFATIFMLLSMGAVTTLAGWCFYRVLTGKRHFDPDGTGPAHSPVPGEAERVHRS